MHRPSWAGYHLKGAYSREWGKTKVLVSGAFRTSVSPVFLYGVSGNQCLISCVGLVPIPPLVAINCIEIRLFPHN